MDSYRFLMYGFGTVGQSIANLLLRAGHEIVAIEPDAAVRAGPLRVSGIDAANILPEARWKQAGTTDVAIHTTTQDIETTWTEITELVSRGQPVITTCEALTCPYDLPEYKELHTLAIRKRVPIVPAGVNPGTVLSEIKSLDVRPYRVEVVRSVDASQRPEDFQQRLGIGVSGADFAQRHRNLGHKGITGLTRLIAYQIYPGLQFDAQVDLTPQIANGTAVGFTQRVRIENFVGSVDFTYRAGLGYLNEEHYRFLTDKKELLSEVHKSGYHGDRSRVAQVMSFAVGIAQAREHEKEVRGFVTVEEAPRAFPWLTDAPLDDYLKR